MAPSASRKYLHDLAEDVLFVILVECDVTSVLALSETSKLFHCVAFTSTVWHSLVTKLVQRGFIDRRSDAEDLKDLSTEQLMAIVKRMLHGPKAWADRPSKSCPVAVRRSLNLFRKLVRKPAVDAATPLGEAKRIVLHPEMAHPMSSFMLSWDNLWNKSKLLPGGKYVLFLNSARLVCWSVFKDRLVWTHRPSMDLTLVHDFEVEMVECDLAVILTCQFINSSELFVEISTVDLKTGVSNLELVSRVPEDFDFYFPHRRVDSVVCGDIVAVQPQHRTRVLLINWRTSSRVLVSVDNIAKSRIAVIPDYLVVTLAAAHEPLARRQLTRVIRDDNPDFFANTTLPGDNDFSGDNGFLYPTMNADGSLAQSDLLSAMDEEIDELASPSPSPRGMQGWAATPSFVQTTAAPPFPQPSFSQIDELASPSPSPQNMQGWAATPAFPSLVEQGWAAAPSFPPKRPLADRFGTVYDGGDPFQTDNEGYCSDPETDTQSPQIGGGYRRHYSATPPPTLTPTRLRANRRPTAKAKANIATASPPEPAPPPARKFLAQRREPTTEPPIPGTEPPITRPANLVQQQQQQSTVQQQSTRSSAQGATTKRRAPVPAAAPHHVPVTAPQHAGPPPARPLERAAPPPARHEPWGSTSQKRPASAAPRRRSCAQARRLRGSSCRSF
ncbi:hypothetical protein B0H14DRAFT_3568226 [Mycena olivaceomarginata]|nr:hypothetical protein B0H14DRAFT_3568226 [Mycena olivaceomarginata]